MPWQGAENKACWGSHFCDRLVLINEEKKSGENLHVDNRAERVQPDLIVDLNYSITVIWHKVYMK